MKWDKQGADVWTATHRSWALHGGTSGSDDFREFAWLYRIELRRSYDGDRFYVSRSGKPLGYAMTFAGAKKIAADKDRSVTQAAKAGLKSREKRLRREAARERGREAQRRRLGRPLEPKSPEQHARDMQRRYARK